MEARERAGIEYSSGMQRRIVPLSILAAVILHFCLFVSGMDATAELLDLPEQYLILPPKQAIRVDGNLAEWDMKSTPYVITAKGNNPKNTIFSNEPTNPVKGDSDLSGRAALAWDNTFLYVAGEMNDDHLLGVKPDSFGNQGPPGWGCDSLMVAIASFRQPMKSNSPFSRFPFRGLRYAPMGPKPRGTLVPGRPGVLDKRDLYWVLTRHSKWAVKETPSGYTVEAAIPWKDLDFTPRAGETLFMAFLAADMDPGEALNQVGWGYVGTPTEHPVFRLATRDDVLGQVTIRASPAIAGVGALTVLVFPSYG